MADTLFFSWQSDTPPIVGRNFIERALERAIGQLAADLEVEEPERDPPLEIDRDTKGVPGSPRIVDTIFQKIDAAAVFLADVTLSGRRLGGQPAPNPNVLIEYGWALKSLTDRRVLTIMNTAYGRPEGEALPFDMRHMRHPIQYHLEADADETARRAARDGLVKTLSTALRDVLAIARPVPQPKRFEPRASGTSPGRYRALGAPLGQADGLMTKAAPIHAPLGPVAWMRLMPTLDPGRLWSIHDLKTAAFNGEPFTPYGLGQVAVGLGWLRDEDGVGIRIVGGDIGDTAPWSAFVFRTGEVWGLDTYLVGAIEFIPLDERLLTEGFTSYWRLLQRLGVVAPYRWIVGYEGVKGRSLWQPGLRVINSTVHTDTLVVEGELTDEPSIGQAVAKVVDTVRDACGMPPLARAAP